VAANVKSKNHERAISSCFALARSISLNRCFVARSNSLNGFSALLVFRLGPAPSKERGRCLLTKFGLAQFAARLFGRLAGDWRRAFNVFDALPPHAVAARYP
jgi:hypothetical protein